MANNNERQEFGRFKVCWFML